MPWKARLAFAAAILLLLSGVGLLAHSFYSLVYEIGVQDGRAQSQFKIQMYSTQRGKTYMYFLYRDKRYRAEELQPLGPKVNIPKRVRHDKATLRGDR